MIVSLFRDLSHSVSEGSTLTVQPPSKRVFNAPFELFVWRLSKPPLRNTTITKRRYFSGHLGLWPRRHAIEQHLFERPDMVR